MRSPEEVVQILDEAIEEAQIYSAELAGYPPDTGAHQIYEYWVEREGILESVLEISITQRVSVVWV